MATFELDKDEQKKCDWWLGAHLQEAHDGKYPYAGAIGGMYSFILTDTSLGQIVSIQCAFCKDKEAPRDSARSGNYTLTDFSNW